MTVSYIYEFFGAAFLFFASFALVKKEKDRVRYPKWIRAGYLALVGLCDLSLASMAPSSVGLNVFAFALSTVESLISVYMCVFSVKIDDGCLIRRTVFSCKKIELRSIDGICKVDFGTALIISSGKRRIKLSKVMRGYDAFCEKLYDFAACDKFFAA